MSATHSSMSSAFDRLRLVDGGVVGDGAVWIGEEKLAFLCIADLDIVEVGERDHRGATYASGNDAFADLADDVVCVDVAKSSPLAPQNALACKREERSKRLRARGLAAHRLQACSCRANEREIKINVFAAVPGLETECERIAPAFLCVGDDMRRQFFSDVCFSICGKLLMFWLSTEYPTPHPCIERYMISAKSSSFTGAVKVQL
jgi:hypothetical protein